jgi:hypothetical protein
MKIISIQPHLKRIAEILDVDIRELLVPTKESKS